MEDVFKYLKSEKIILSIIVLVLGFTIYFILKKIFIKIVHKNKEKLKITNRNRTYIRLFKNIIKYILIIVVVVTILNINGVNVSSILAGIGIVSVIVGLSLQDALKDIIMGINIIVDRYFSVGDVVRIDEIEGKILEIGLKSTKMQDIYNQNIYTISNREISKALILSNQLDIDVPLPYEQKIENVENVIDVIVNEISSLKNVLNVEYRGLQEFESSAIYYKIRLQVKPENKPQVRRDANRIVKLTLDKNNISIPYTQIDIHTK